jgi:hypothetical protein
MHHLLKRKIQNHQNQHESKKSKGIKIWLSNKSKWYQRKIKEFPPLDFQQKIFHEKLIFAMLLMIIKLKKFSWRTFRNYEHQTFIAIFYFYFFRRKLHFEDVVIEFSLTIFLFLRLFLPLLIKNKMRNKKYYHLKLYLYNLLCFLPY